jgi:CheY-like chemotaxis protein
VLTLLQKLATRVTDAEIECFRAAQDALAAFEAQPNAFSLVLTDLDMPEMTGLQLCALLRAMSPKLKVLFVTANESLSGEAALHKGFCGVIRKPFSITELESALVAAMEKKNCGLSPALAPA